MKSILKDCQLHVNYSCYNKNNVINYLDCMRHIQYTYRYYRLVNIHVYNNLFGEWNVLHLYRSESISSNGIYKNRFNKFIVLKAFHIAYSFCLHCPG